MITKKDILTTVSSALAQAIHGWLDDHRQPLLQALVLALANPAPAKARLETPPDNQESQYLTTVEVAKR
jgi:hypothetical protein